MIKVSIKGTWDKTMNFLNNIINKQEFDSLDSYGQAGVNALASATPRDTGLTANSWSYKIIRSKNKIKIQWFNSNATASGTPIAILIQYGHTTKAGYYVEGKDFINPAIQPIFDSLAEQVWGEIIRQ